ncbi:MAG TPA: hypothetical protein H9753_11315 [Candidatus Blautia merdavium]|uniref:Uncharacterized protein n=1 Tax=Candidatus Blautia merdavium TaxID=2838494 RepID=A0A9D2PPW8_9FIRM|nr:hypothetical protein [Candidatus Blautia merdavium]
MEYEKTKLVEEENTIYEIDLDCMRRKGRMSSCQERVSCAMIKNNDEKNRSDRHSGGKNRAEIRSKRT